MQIKPNKTILPKVLAGLIVILIATVAYFTYANFTDSWPFSNGKDTSEITKEKSKANNPVSENTNPKDGDSPTANAPVEFTPPNDDDTPKEDVLTGIINYKGVMDNNLIIRTTINQLINSGECRLKLTSEPNKIIEETAKVITSASTSTCDGFSVPASKLSTGKWNIEINLTSGSKQGVLKSTLTI